MITEPNTRLDADIRDAIARSHFRHLPDETIAELVFGSYRIHVAAGSSVRMAGEEGPHLELLLDGFVRIFVTAPDGRSLTVRYFRRGALTGVASLFTPRFAMPGSIQALVDSDVLVFDPATVRGISIATSPSHEPFSMSWPNGSSAGSPRSPAARSRASGSG